MKKLPETRGMHSLIGKDYSDFSFVLKKAKNISKIYNFSTILMPLLEHASIFTRTLGITSDIVNKEMYCFHDRSNDLLIMRPEFTAGIARYYINNMQSHPQPIKLFSYGPLFRYERPQKGRSRQFHQFNYEVIGTDSVNADVELIDMAEQILCALSIKNKTTLEINSLGNNKSRMIYRKTLQEFFQDHTKYLSQNSIDKIEKNPLRILDSKSIEEQNIIHKAPKISEYYDSESKDRFEEILSILQSMNIKYTINERLVRGMDYYEHTVFEIKEKDKFNKSQNTIIAGGRYDGLISLMNSSIDSPAMGFAGGIERISNLMTTNKSTEPIKYSIVAKSSQETHLTFIIANILRKDGFIVQIPYHNTFRKQIKKSVDYDYCLIVDKEDYEKGETIIKDMSNGKEMKIELTDITKQINNIIKFK